MDEIDEMLEQPVTFKAADKVIYGVLNYEGNEYMATISGYDVQIAFNMRLINSLADAEACANAIADVFYNALMEQLILEKKEIVQPPDKQ